MKILSESNKIERRRNVIFILFALLIIPTEIFLLNYFQNKKLTDNMETTGGMDLSFYLNGTLYNNYNETAFHGKLVNVTCSNHDAEWDYADKTLRLKNFNLGASSTETCTINYTNPSTSYNTLTNKIFAQSNGTCNVTTYTNAMACLTNGKSWTAGGANNLYYEGNALRYEGDNPNNFINFNGELWRIIGLFNGSKIGGTTNQFYAKIIRTTDIGSFSWDNNTTASNYGASLLYKTLNNYYFYNLTPSSTSYCQTALYASGSSSLTPILSEACRSLGRIGIKQNYRSYVFKAKWNNTESSGFAYAQNTVNFMLSLDNTTGASDLAYVGLMYLSDYMYGVKASDCSRSLYLESYAASAGTNCFSKNWLNMGPYDRRIMARGSDPTPVLISASGLTTTKYAKIGYPVIPVVYLNYTEKVYTGSGTMSSPFVLL